MNPHIFPYLRHILWEAPIQTLASLVIRSGDDILDVGSNTGALAIAFGRMTGRGGRVLGFECNPRMIAWAQQNAEVNESPHVVLAGKACFHTAGLELEFFADNSTFSVGSSLVFKEGEGELLRVETTTIDAECAARRLSPSLIKIDVEGAEADVLMGADETLKRCQPVVILERQNDPPADRDPIVLLARHGYRSFDVNSLEEIAPGWAGWRFPANIMSVPARVSGGFDTVETLEMSLSADRKSAQSPVLREGLHHIALDIVCSGNALGELEVRDESGEQILYFNAPAQHLADPTCAYFPIRASEGGHLTVSVVGDMEIGAVKMRRIEQPRGLMEPL